MGQNHLYHPNPSAEAVQAWLVAWQAAYPAGGVLALVAEHSREEIPVLQQLCTQAQITLAGAVFPKLIHEAQFLSTGVLLYGLDRMPAHVLVSALNKDAERAIAALTACADGAATGDSLMMIFDGLVPNIATVLESLYAEVGDRVHYMGVNAGSESFASIPCLFDNEQLIADGALMMCLQSHEGAVLEHGYAVPDDMIPATSSRGNCIAQINWQPAFKVYAELVKRHYDVEITPENFYTHAVHFPFGIIRADGEVLVRIPVALEDDGSIFCVGEIPENNLLTVIHAAIPGSHETVDALMARLDGSQGYNGLVFYCAGRRMHLAEAADQELALLGERLAPAALEGAMSLGEIGSARQGRYPLFHNATIVMIPGLDA